MSRLLSDQGGTPGTGALLAVGRWLSFAGVLLVVGVALLSVWTASLPTPPSARSASGGSVSGGFVLGDWGRASGCG
ncbi:MAG: hypothetical protein ACKV2O_18015 [Acidimicrobiales bacterium]